MNKKKIVIISRAIFPNQSPRALRTTELATELARQGHEVSVYAALGKYNYGEFQDVHKIKINNIGKMRFAIRNSDLTTRPAGFIYRVLNKILKRVIDFPDIEYVFKTANVIKKLSDFDILITIGLPHTIHWGAALGQKGKSSRSYTWIADCGDPYMGNKFHRRFFYFKYVEKWFCRKVDFITIPTESAKTGYYKEFHDKIRVIPQGFRFDKGTLNESFEANNIPTFVYAGTFYKGLRDPSDFLTFLSTVDIDFRLIVYTQTKELLIPFQNVLKDKLKINDYIPRTELLKVMAGADFLINFENDSSIQSPSKLIDYALSGRPILSIRPRLDKQEVLNFLNGCYDTSFVVTDIDRYNIETVASQFISLAQDRTTGETVNS